VFFHCSNSLRIGSGRSGARVGRSRSDRKELPASIDRGKGFNRRSEAEWPPLKPETLARKDDVNTPLLETGALRDSIAWNSDPHEGYVGSNSEIVRYQEFGMSRGIPPRPVLGLAAVQNERKVEHIAEKAVAAAVGSALGGVGEIFRSLREAGRAKRRTSYFTAARMRTTDE
jgi:phage gpG-like protein